MTWTRISIPLLKIETTLRYAQNFEVKKPESDSDDTINDKIDLLKDLIYKV